MQILPFASRTRRYRGTNKNGAGRNRRHDFVNKLRLLRARQSGMRKGCGIWITERSTNGIRSCSHFEPLQQRYDLRVISKHLVPLSYQDWDSRNWKDFDGVAFFQIRLTNLGRGCNARELPRWNNGVHK